MFITCDSKAKMGYIYLQSPKENSPIWRKDSDNNLRKYLDGTIPEIPVGMGSEDIEKRLNNLTVSKKTYLEDLGIIYEEEFLNDKKDGYLTGIELNLTREQFTNGIKSKIYRIYELEWQERRFLLLTLDYLDNVFDPNSIIYPANKNNDVFYIIAIEDEVSYIKAIVSSRPDLYDIEYLKTPRFILY